MCTLSAQPWQLPAQILLDYTASSSSMKNVHQGEIIAPCPKRLLLAMPRPLTSNQRAAYFDLVEPQCVDRTGLPFEICAHSDGPVAEVPKLPDEMQSRDWEHVPNQNVKVVDQPPYGRITINEDVDDAEPVDSQKNDANNDTEAFTEFIAIVHTASTQIGTLTRSSSPVNVPTFDDRRSSSNPPVSPSSPSPNAGSSRFPPSLSALNAETEFDVSDSTLGSSPVSRSVNPMPRDRSFAPTDAKRTVVTCQRSRRGSLESPVPVQPFSDAELSACKLRQLRIDNVPEAILFLRTFPKGAVPVLSRSRSLSGENSILNRRRWNIRCDQFRSVLS